VRIAGSKSHAIAEVLGYRGRSEMIHRDDMALFGVDERDPIEGLPSALGKA